MQLSATSPQVLRWFRTTVICALLLWQRPTVILYAAAPRFSTTTHTRAQELEGSTTTAAPTELLSRLVAPPETDTATILPLMRTMQRRARLQARFLRTHIRLERAPAATMVPTSTIARDRPHHLRHHHPEAAVQLPYTRGQACLHPRACRHTPVPQP
jgi:hypothetical protein